ncbi:hypothetical protein [Streptomyces sp. DH12]|uniref:hypothetical protein n=1 Tax=Streptomyces sp. DH12 TaxID=2857010 RepID=UPI001E341538|nr:hypothetical protein [Streptomyces sp. DH12]
MHTPDEQQPRIPGVRYRRVTRERDETTTIDGITVTYRVPYEVEEPVPPRDWDEVILRAEFIAALLFTLTAIVTTATSFGRLLSPLLGEGVAYAAGAAFASGWLVCLGYEWLDRDDPTRAGAARTAGWVVLAYSMAAVLMYGHKHDEMPAAAVGACIDVVAKGSWWLLFRQYAVPLPAGTAHWLNVQEQTIAARARVGTRFRRLDRRAAYQQAVGGRHYQAAGALLDTVQERALPTAARTVSASLRKTSGRPAQEPAPVAPTPAPVPPVAPTPPVYRPSGDVAGHASAQVNPPPQPVQAPTTDTTSASAPDTPGHPSAAGPDHQPVGHGQPAHQLHVVPTSIRQTTFDVLDQDPDIDDDALLAHVRAVHGDSRTLAGTVERYRRKHAEKSAAS